MRTRRETTIRQLRTAIDCLPVDTKIAMLEGIRSNPIIVGAYTHRDGICPMLAAHRAGGRTNFISFARAWDRYGFRDARKRQARRATERELLVLKTHLEASLLGDEAPSAELGAAIADHRELMARRPARRPEPQPARAGDANRMPELRSRPGWAWLRVVRRYDDYQRALARLEESPETRRDLVSA